MNDQQRPYAGRELTRRERRQADRAAAKRAEQRAKAMPPPEQHDRTDPVTGRPVYTGVEHELRRPGAAPLPDHSIQQLSGSEARRPGTSVERATPRAPARLPAPPAPHATPFGLPATPPAGGTGEPAPQPHPPQRPDASQAQTPHPGPAASIWGAAAPLHGSDRDQFEAVEDAQSARPDRRGRAGGRLLPSRRRRAPKPTPSLAEQAARAEARAARTARWRGYAPPQTAPWWFVAGLLAVLAAVAVACLSALELLTIPATWWNQWYLLGGVAAVTASGTLALRRGWNRSPNKIRVPGVVFVVLASAALIVGVLSDPVVIDGRVYSSTSMEARSVRLAEEMSADLERMAVLDELLVADLATARSQVSLYEPAVAELVKMSDKWANRTDVPDPAFAGVVDGLKTTAYWQAEAMTSKAALIEEADDRTETDLETQRATFTNNWIAVSQQLNEVGIALGIPTNDQTGGPHE